MGIDGIQPPSDASSRYRVEQDKTAQKKPDKAKHSPEKPKTDSFLEMVQQQREKAAQTKPAEQPVEKQANPNIDQLQALEEGAKLNQARYQTNQEVATIDNSILEVRRQILKESTDMVETPVLGEKESKSYWDRLEVMEKARKINQLKDKIINLELQRNQLVSALKEQVMSGTYNASGNEIYEGMLKEFF